MDSIPLHHHLSVGLLQLETEFQTLDEVAELNRFLASMARVMLNYFWPAWSAFYLMAFCPCGRAPILKWNFRVFLYASIRNQLLSLAAFGAAAPREQRSWFNYLTSNSNTRRLLQLHKIYSLFHNVAEPYVHGWRSLPLRLDYSRQLQRNSWHVVVAKASQRFNNRQC